MSLEQRKCLSLSNLSRFLKKSWLALSNLINSFPVENSKVREAAQSQKPFPGEKRWGDTEP